MADLLSIFVMLAFMLGGFVLAALIILLMTEWRD
jgi:hypothetical protein